MQKQRNPQQTRARAAGRWARALLSSIALALAFPATSEAVTVTFSGLATDGKGLVAHASDPSETIFDAATSLPITHPNAAIISGIYRRLRTIDAFDTDTGVVTPALTTLPAGADAPAGHGLSSIQLTATDDNPILLSASDFFLDISSPADYHIDLVTFRETRIYRQGNISLFEDDGGPTQILSYSDLVANMVIDWSLHGTGTPNITVDIVLPSGLMHVISIDAIQVDGNTPEGPFGIFDIMSAEVTLVHALPTSTNAVLLTALGLLGVGAFLVERAKSPHRASRA